MEKMMIYLMTQQKKFEVQEVMLNMKIILLNKQMTEVMLNQVHQRIEFQQTKFVFLLSIKVKEN